jgi:hypothetical protein
VNQTRPAIEPPDATPELCADFAKLAPVAALVPKWCDATHPIGKAYQAAVFILVYAVEHGAYSYVPAAYRVHKAIEALLAMGAMECILDCLPREVRARIEQRLQQLAVAQEDRGDVTSSYYSRALSGERCPKPQDRLNKRAHLRLVK